MKTYTTKANANRAAKNIIKKFEVVETAFATPFADGYTLEITIVAGEEAPVELKDFQVIETLLPVVEEEVKDLAETKPAKIIKRKSDISGPCSEVWNICDAMVGARRKDVIEACVQSGIAFYTARTQYQQWKKATEATPATDAE
jgi:hypothetical protein